MKLNRNGYMLVEIIVAFALAFSMAIYLLNLTIKFKDTNDDIYYSAKYLKDKNLITRNIMEDISRGIIRDIEHTPGNNEIMFTIYIDGKQENKELRKLVIFEDSGFGIEYGKVDESGNFDKKDISYYRKKLDSSLVVNKDNIVIESESASNMFDIKIPIDSLYSDEKYNIVILGKSYGEVICNDKYTNYYILLASLSIGTYKDYINSTGWIYNTSTIVPALNVIQSLNIPPEDKNNVNISYVCLTRGDGNTDHCTYDYDEVKRLSKFYEVYVDAFNGEISNYENYEYELDGGKKITASVYTDPSNTKEKYILHNFFSESGGDLEESSVQNLYDYSSVLIDDLVNASVFPSSFGISIGGTEIIDIHDDLKKNLIDNNLEIAVNREVSSLYNGSLREVEISYKENNSLKNNVVFSPLMFKVEYNACEKQ